MRSRFSLHIVVESCIIRLTISNCKKWGLAKCIELQLWKMTGILSKN